MDLYAENILEHFRHPHRKSALQNPTVEHRETNASCGDAVTVRLVVERGVIADVGWEGDGCAISQASMSMLADLLVGMTTDEALALTTDDVLAMLGVDVGPSRLKCALLSLQVTKNALAKM